MERFRQSISWELLSSSVRLGSLQEDSWHLRAACRLSSTYMIYASLSRHGGKAQRGLFKGQRAGKKRSRCSFIVLRVWEYCIAVGANVGGGVTVARFLVGLFRTRGSGDAFQWVQQSLLPLRRDLDPTGHSVRFHLLSTFPFHELDQVALDFTRLCQWAGCRVMIPRRH